MNIRVGLGYDIHPLLKARPLFLGGLKIRNKLGLKGHSDADVLLHSLSDALLGAMGLGDIGMYFPDNVISTRDISSSVILGKVLGILRKNKFKILNVDTVLITQDVRLSSRRKKMTNNLSKLLGIAENRISIKAKSNQGLGLFGERRAIACFSVCLIGK